MLQYFLDEGTFATFLLLRRLQGTTKLLAFYSHKNLKKAAHATRKYQTDGLDARPEPHVTHLGQVSQRVEPGVIANRRPYPYTDV